MYDLRLVENFKIFCCGPSRSGKTHFVVDLVQNLSSFCKFPPTNVIYIYKIWQSKFNELLESGLVNFFIEDQMDLLAAIKQKTFGKPTLIIFDDMMNSKNLSDISNLFVIDGRHPNYSLIFIAQRMFLNNENFRQISNNSDYLVIFRNTRNKSEIRVLAQQLTPGSLDLIDIYEMATREPFSYLFINLTQECPEDVKYLSNLFDFDHYIKCFAKST